MGINSVLYSVFISLLLRMSILTVVILAIKAAFRYKLSASMHSAIWFILAAQFVFCVFNIKIQAGTSIYNYIPSDAAVTAGAVQAASSGGGFDIRNLISFIWFFTGAGLFIWYMIVYIRHRLEIRRMPLAEDRETIRILNDLKTELEINSVITLRYGAIAETTGKTVIIPESFSYDELKQIMLHELCHFKNKDCLKLWAAIVIVSLNWFNPLIWYAFLVFRTDIEMLCDDRVIKLTDSRKCYATALVHSSMAKSKFIPGTTSLHNGKYEVTKRVKRLVSWKKKKPVWAIIAVFVCAGISCLCLTDAVTHAVENTVVDIAKVPEPINDVSDVIPIPAAQPEDEYVQDEPEYDELSADDNVEYTEPEEPEYNAEPEGAEYDEPEYGAEYDEPPYDEAEYVPSYDESEYVPMYSVEEEPEVDTGEEREDVYDEMGEPDEAAANGSKETYNLDDGSTVIVHYDDEGTVERGYILDAQADSGEEE